MKHRKKKASTPVRRNSETATEPATRAPALISPPRLWFFRIACLVSPILLLLLIEAGLRIFGFGHSNAFFLPTTINGHGSWIQNDKYAERFLGREMARQPFPSA